MKINKILKTILSIIFNILLIIVLIILFLSIYCIIQVKVQGKDYANLFGYAFFEIETGSMEDTINAGDAIIVKLTKDVEIDDIIVYKKDNNYITHRIIEINNEKIITKGDANNSLDDEITDDQICGKVCYTIRNLDSIKKTFSNPIVLTAIFITVVLIGVLIFYKPKEKEKKKSKDNVEGE